MNTALEKILNKTLIAAMSSIAIAALYTFPASAAVGTLPEGDRLFTLECGDSDNGVNDSQLYEIDPVSGDMTPIGTGQATDDGGCNSNVAYDPTTGIYWSFDWSDVDPDLGGSQYGLLKIDIQTGAITSGPATSIDGNPSWGDNYSIAINADGDAFAIGVNEVFTLDLETGEVTSIWQTNIGTNDGGGAAPYGAAFNPADGLLYVQYDGSRNLYALDLDTETFELVTQFPSGDDWYGPFGFDSEGNVWQQNNMDFFAYSLSDVETLTERVPMSLNESQVWTESFFVAAANPGWSAKLAETGFDSAGWLAVAGLTLAAGAALIRRRATL